MPTDGIVKVTPTVGELDEACSILGSGDTEMHRFIAHENIKRFNQQLGNCPDRRQRETLEQLLAAEEGKLKDLMRPRR